MNPPTAPMALINAMPAAAAPPVRNLPGSAQNGPRSAVVADRGDRERDHRGNRRLEQRGGDEADCADGRRNRDVHESFAGAIGAAADQHHADRRGDVRQR